MTHSKSVYLWDRLPLLAFVQFPWRFLGIAMFAGAILSGSLFLFIKKKYHLYLAITLSFFIIALNFGYFRVDQYDPQMTDEKKLSGKEYTIQSMATLMDYMPTQVQEFPKELAPDSPWIVTGDAQISQFRKRSNFWRFTVENSTNQPATIKVPVFNFPHWTVLLDQQPVAFRDNNPEGVIELDIPPGKYTVVGRFENTPLRSVANALSMTSLVALILYLVISDKKSLS